MGNFFQACCPKTDHNDGGRTDRVGDGRRVWSERVAEVVMEIGE